MTRITIFAVAAFALILGCLSTLHRLYHARQHEFLATEAQAMQSLIEERFKLYHRSAYAQKTMADEFWKRANVTPKEFEAMGATIISHYPEVIGANFVTPQGIIALVYPLKTNAPALGRKTQNFDILSQLYSQGERGIWLSPPFELMQGERGFVYYFPLVRQDRLIGWYGIVFSEEKFLQYFLQNQQFRNFDIEVTDDQTQKDYIATEKRPLTMRDPYLRSGTFKLLGRQITVHTWPKDFSVYSTEWSVLILIALFFSGLSTAALNFFLQRRQGHRQVEELNHLLKLVIQDSTNSVTKIKGYVEMMKEDPQLVPVEKLARHVGFVVDLVEQIKVVKTLSEPNTDWHFTQQSLLPLILEAAELVSDRLTAKELTLDYNPEEIAPVQVTIIPTLFVHNGLANVLGFVSKFSDPGSNISMKVSQESGKIRILFTNPQGRGKSEKIEEMGFLIVKRVIELHRGEIIPTDFTHPGLRVEIILPAQ